MARRRRADHARASGLNELPPRGSWGALQALMNDGGQVTLGAIGPFPGAAAAAMPGGMLAGLVRRQGESWNALLRRLDEAVMQSVVENRVINEMQRDL
jgi:hypothetical protein